MKLTTPPLAPSTLQALEKLGIATLADLRAQGAAASFLLLKAAGLTLTRSPSVPYTHLSLPTLCRL